MLKNATLRQKQQVPPGDAQGALPPAPPPKGLRPFGIPLMQRITCAAEGKGWTFVSTRGKSRREAAGFAVFGREIGNGQLSWAAEGRPRRGAGTGNGNLKAKFLPRCADNCAHLSAQEIQNASPSPSKSRRRPAGFAPGRNVNMPFSPAMRIGLPKGLRPLSRVHGTSPPPCRAPHPQ